MAEAEIRRAEPGDAPTVVTLIGEFRDHLGAKAPLDADLERYVPYALSRPESEACIAWLDGEAVGYTWSRFTSSVWAVGVEAHLDDLFVQERARGKSIGRALLRFALARAKQHEARRFTLNTNQRNEQAQALYRSEGFEPQAHALFPDSFEQVWVIEPV